MSSSAFIVRLFLPNLDIPVVVQDEKLNHLLSLCTFYVVSSLFVRRPLCMLVKCLSPFLFVFVIEKPTLYRPGRTCLLMDIFVYAVKSVEMKQKAIHTFQRP